jgi:hypothetical protein
MHGLVHSLFWQEQPAASLAMVGNYDKARQSKLQGPVGARRTGSEVGNQQIVARAKKNFSRLRGFRFQVYKQYRYTSIVIVLTQALFCG